MYINSWLGRGIIDVPVKTLSDHIKDIRSYRMWDNLLVVCGV